MVCLGAGLTASLRLIYGMINRAPRPMLATLGSPPHDSAGFAVEAKYDGQRGLAVVSADVVTLWSRNGANITDTFPEITAAMPQAVAGRPVILDGEIVALDKDGAPSFGRLRRRWPQNRRPDAQLLRDVPVRFYMFDILAAEGHSLMHLPYVQRRGLLATMTEDAHTAAVRIPPCWTDVEPQLVLGASAELGLEGIVCKRLDSPYLPGRRSPHWIKTPLRRRNPFIIGGWLPGIGANHQSVGALLVGAHGTDGLLQLCGVVGAGISVPQRRLLLPELLVRQRNTSPFSGAIPDFIAHHPRWVTPRLVGDVEYRELTATLRHPSWKGLRTNLDADDVVLQA